jgi:hypothetical protein
MEASSPAAPRTTMPRHRLVACAAGAAIVLAACGGSGPSRGVRAAAHVGGECTARGLARVAAASGIAAGAIATKHFTESDGSAACRFTASRADGGPLSLTVDVDAAPQALNHLDREVVEYSQGVIWFHLGAHAYPQTITHLGLTADWFPAKREVMTTDGDRIVNVTVASCPRRAGRGEALATAVARRYLGPLHPPTF